MWKKLLAIVLIFMLFIAPLAARLLYFYKGLYQPQEVSRPDLAEVSAPPPETAPFTDRFVSATPGVILVDKAHQNRLDMSELSVLQARLAARGQRLQPLGDASDLAEQLEYAKALLILSPGEGWQADEIREIKSFVQKGGRLLLATDPTRSATQYDDWGYSTGLDSDVSYINDLAAQFGLTFRSDYLYNTSENQGNFRNIKLTELSPHALTADLEQIVFYAAHSIDAQEQVLIYADGETRSSESERDQDLAVAALGGDGAVLALGDWTFMMRPFNTAYDNDQFIANIANFVSGAERRYELADFPFFFQEQVDLVYVGDPLLDSDILADGGALQTHLHAWDKALIVREAQDSEHDTLFFGLYAYTEEIEPYLETAGVSFLFTTTAAITPIVPGGAVTPTSAITQTTAPITLTESAAFSPTAALTSTSPVAPIEPLTSTLELTPALELTTTLDLTDTNEVTAAATVSPAVNRVNIDAIGQMVVTGTSLLLLQTHGEHEVLIVLANTEQGLSHAVQRLTSGDFVDCVLREDMVEQPFSTLALCPTDELESGEGVGGWQKAEPASQQEDKTTPESTATPTSSEPITDTGEIEPPAEPQGSILVMAFDAGEGRYDSMTSADDYVEILQDYYEVTVWSKAAGDFDEFADTTGYDLIIWTLGDFEFALDEDDSMILFNILIYEQPLIISGAYFDEYADRAVQRDIQVVDASHPIAQGFEQDEVITFVTPPSGSEYEVDIMEGDPESEENIFARGPNSEAAGEYSVSYYAEDEEFKVRMLMISFPLYLLPQEAKTRIVLNAVDWLLTED